MRGAYRVLMAAALAVWAAVVAPMVAAPQRYAAGIATGGAWADGVAAPTAQSATGSADRSHLLAAARPWRTATQIARIKAYCGGPGETFRFVVMGDSRSNPKVFGDLLGITAGLKPDFSLHTGDIVRGGNPEEFAQFFSQIEDVRWPFLIVIGNHELGPSGGGLYRELFGRTDYHFDCKGYRFVSVDNAGGAISAQQLAWLERVLTTDLRKIVLVHIPPSVIEEWNWHSFATGAREFAELIAAKRVERVYVGHIHGFDVAEHQGVRYVLTGGAGAPLYEQTAPGNFYHVVLVEAGPDGLRETVHKLDGTSFVIDPRKWISGAGQ